MHWKKLSTKKILDHHRLKVYEDIVELPDGQQTDYIYFGGRDSVTIIAKSAEDKILLQKEYSYPLNKKLFQFPGGGMENGETPTETATRELAEEGHLNGSLEHIGSFYVNNRRTSQMMHVFQATNLKKSFAEKDTEEEFQNFWLTVDEINELITNHEIQNYSTLAAWALYQNH